MLEMNNIHPYSAVGDREKLHQELVKMCYIQFFCLYKLINYEIMDIKGGRDARNAQYTPLLRNIGTSVIVN